MQAALAAGGHLARGADGKLRKKVLAELLTALKKRRDDVGRLARILSRRGQFWDTIRGLRDIYVLATPVLVGRRVAGRLAAALPAPHFNWVERVSRGTLVRALLQLCGWAEKLAEVFIVFGLGLCGLPVDVNVARVLRLAPVLPRLP